MIDGLAAHVIAAHGSVIDGLAAHGSVIDGSGTIAPVCLSRVTQRR